MGLESSKREERMDGILKKPTLPCLILLVGGLLLIPNGLDARYQRMITFEIVTLLASSIYVFFSISKSVGALLIYVIASYSFHEAIDMPTRNILFAGIITYILTAKSKGGKAWLYNCICVVAMVNVGWQMLQLNGVWWSLSGDDTLTGFVSNTNEMAALMAVCIPCFMRRRWNLLLPIPLLGLLLSAGLGGALALSLAGLVALVEYRKILPLMGIVSGLAALVMIFGMVLAFKGSSRAKPFYSSAVERWTYWTQELIPVVKQHPWIGWGIGQYKYVMPLIVTPQAIKPERFPELWSNVGDKAGTIICARERKSTKEWKEAWTEAHNDYLELLFAIGGIGLFLTLAMLVRSLIIAQGIERYGLLISALSAIWFFSWQIAPIAILTITYLGMIYRQENNYVEKCC